MAWEIAVSLGLCMSCCRALREDSRSAFVLEACIPVQIACKFVGGGWVKQMHELICCDATVVPEYA